MTQQAKTQKQVQIIARYFLKKSGIVCYAVRSSNGADIYRTCVANGRVSCTCPGFEKFHKCYHSAQVLVLEQQRSEAQAAKVEQALAEAWAMVEANWQEAEQVSTPALAAHDDTYCTHCQTNTLTKQCYGCGCKVCVYCGFMGTGDKHGKWFCYQCWYNGYEKPYEEQVTPALVTYDIVGAALQVVNAEIVAQQIGDAYEQVGDPRLTREQYVNMFGIYE